VSGTHDPARGLAIALVVGVVLLQLPYGTYPLYPWKLLGTWLHEGGHALAMLVTGTGFRGMEIYRDGSGLAHAASLAGPAGYLGAPIGGVIVMMGARTARGARRVLVVLGALLVITAAWSIVNRFGQVALGATGVGLLVVAAIPRPRVHTGVASFVAAQACVGALVDIRVLFRPNLVVDGQLIRDSDAHSMAVATFGTAANWAVWTWAAIWLAWSLAILFVVLRRWSRVMAPPPAEPAAPPA
jgi:hypothetical protein